MALYEGTEFVKGQVKDTNFGSYTPLRIGGVPELDIVFIGSTEAPVGLGEPGTTVVAPAIGNAIFAAVGVRLRHLPIRRAAVLEGTHVTENGALTCARASNQFERVMGATGHSSTGQHIVRSTQP
jgi:CO/xanthine dehydrogenase Mo-binding subunit